MLKLVYVTEVFHVLTIGLGKLPFMVLFYTIISGSNLTVITRTIAGFGFVLVLWTLTMIIATSLQCQPPTVWDLTGQCLNVVSMISLALVC